MGEAGGTEGSKRPQAGTESPRADAAASGAQPSGPQAAQPSGPQAAQPSRAKASQSDGALNALLRTEAHRVLSENMLQPDPARVADGWERRFIADGKRAEEAIALYEELGYEVCADPVRSEELRDECEACRLVALLRFQTIYTRRREE